MQHGDSTELQDGVVVATALSDKCIFDSVFVWHQQCVCMV